MRHAVSKIAYGLEWVAIGLLAWIGYSLDFDLTKLDDDPLLQSVVRWCQDRAAQLVIGAAVFVVVMRLVRWSVQEKTREQKLLNRLVTEALDKFRSKCFPDIPATEPLDNNRVTVFKHVSWKWWIWPFRGFLHPWGWRWWPWSGWLVVVQRSGHLTQTGTAIFLAPDEAPHCEGVAGQAWRRGAYRVGRGDHKLPNLNNVEYTNRLAWCWFQLRAWLGSHKPAVTNYLERRQKIEAYAEATNTSPGWVWYRIKRRKVNPISILAVPILDQNDEPWGVLVMDSSNDYECIDTDLSAFRTAFRNLRKALQKYGVLGG